ncbi:MAG: Rid family hydrolase [Cyclobacteriaceae bacterium]
MSKEIIYSKEAPMPIGPYSQAVSINDAYGQYFKIFPPARETVEVRRLPKDVNVEISCIAVKVKP